MMIDGVMSTVKTLIFVGNFDLVTENCQIYRPRNVDLNLMRQYAIKGHLSMLCYSLNKENKVYFHVE